MVHKIVIYIPQWPSCPNRYKYLEMKILENGGINAKTIETRLYTWLY